MVRWLFFFCRWISIEKRHPIEIWNTQVDASSKEKTTKKVEPTKNLQEIAFVAM